MSGFLSVWESGCMGNWMFDSVLMSTYLAVRQSRYLAVWLSGCLYVCLSLCLNY